jgi:predicted dehydrogenase
MDCLRPGDVAIFATPPAFRWAHFAYAIQKGLNVFMEKPVSVDAPTSVKMFQLAEESKKRNQKVGVGLMCRHCRARGELFDRIKDGAIGDLTTLRAYRLAGTTASAFSTRKPDSEPSELIWQIKRFHSFLWLSGGAVSDFLIHNIDECCWMKDAWPVKAQASGGRHYRGDNVDQNFDNASIEYTHADGAKLFLYGRTIENCYETHSSYAHGALGSAIISESGHMPSKCRLFKNQDMQDANITWAGKQPESNPYQMEWDDLIAAIRDDKPYNETSRHRSQPASGLGRMAAHTGQITREELLKVNHEFAPRRQAGHGFALATAGRRGRPISGSAAGEDSGNRILSSGGTSLSSQRRAWSVGDIPRPSPEALGVPHPLNENTSGAHEHGESQSGDYRVGFRGGVHPDLPKASGCGGGGRLPARRRQDERGGRRVSNRQAVHQV